MRFLVAYLLVLVAMFLGAVIFIGYPGDGAEGCPTAFGRMERASPQIARIAR